MAHRACTTATVRLEGRSAWCDPVLEATHLSRRPMERLVSSLVPKGMLGHRSQAWPTYQVVRLPERHAYRNDGKTERYIPRRAASVSQRILPSHWLSLRMRDQCQIHSNHAQIPKIVAATTIKASPNTRFSAWSSFPVTKSDTTRRAIPQTQIATPWWIASTCHVARRARPRPTSTCVQWYLVPMYTRLTNKHTGIAHLRNQRMAITNEYLTRLAACTTKGRYIQMPLQSQNTSTCRSVPRTLTAIKFPWKSPNARRKSRVRALRRNETVMSGNTHFHPSRFITFIQPLNPSGEVSRQTVTRRFVLTFIDGVWRKNDKDGDITGAKNRMTRATTKEAPRTKRTSARWAISNAAPPVSSSPRTNM